MHFKIMELSYLRVSGSEPVPNYKVSCKTITPVSKAPQMQWACLTEELRLDCFPDCHVQKDELQYLNFMTFDHCI